MRDISFGRVVLFMLHRLNIVVYFRMNEIKIHDTWHDLNNTDKIYTYDVNIKSYNSAG